MPYHRQPRPHPPKRPHPQGPQQRQRPGGQGKCGGAQHSGAAKWVVFTNYTELKTGAGGGGGGAVTLTGVSYASGNITFNLANFTSGAPYTAALEMYTGYYGWTSVGTISGNANVSGQVVVNHVLASGSYRLSFGGTTLYFGV